MGQDVRAGVTVAGLGVVIALGLAALSTRGEPYMLWADVLFGIVASGLFILGLRLIIRSSQL